MIILWNNITQSRECGIIKVFDAENLFSVRISHSAVFIAMRCPNCARRFRLKFMGRVCSHASIFCSKLINHLEGSPDDEWQVLYRKYIIIMMVSLFISVRCVRLCVRDTPICDSAAFYALPRISEWSPAWYAVSVHFIIIIEVIVNNLSMAALYVNAEHTLTRE